MSNRFHYISQPPLGAVINPSHHLSQGLVGMWLMNEGGGLSATDLSVSHNTGTLTGGPTWGPGRVGVVLKFDGVNDYVVANNNTSITSTKISITLWVKFNALGVLNSRMVDLRDGSNGVQILFEGGSGKFGTKHSQFEAGSNATVWNTPVIGTLYNVVAVWDSVANTTNFYINGVAQTGAANFNVGNGNQANKIYLGTRGDQFATTWLDGFLDNIRVYNRALSANEVQQLFVNPYVNFLMPKRRMLIGAVVVGGSSVPSFAQASRHFIGVGVP